MTSTQLVFVSLLSSHPFSFLSYELPRGSMEVDSECQEVLLQNQSRRINCIRREMHRADNFDLFQISLDPCIKPVEDVFSNAEVDFKKCNHFRNVVAIFCNTSPHFKFQVKWENFRSCSVECRLSTERNLRPQCDFESHCLLSRINDYNSQRLQDKMKKSK